jgi:hypothetical protein
VAALQVHLSYGVKSGAAVNDVMARHFLGNKWRLGIVGAIGAVKAGSFLWGLEKIHFQRLGN